jgi:hypothetical protein
MPTKQKGCVRIVFIILLVMVILGMLLFFAGGKNW